MNRTVLWVNKPDQLAVLTNPVRHDILDRLVALGPMSVRDIAAALGRRPSAIYHHLRQLETAGLVRARGVKVGKGRPSAEYEAAAALIRLARAASNERNHRPMTRVARAIGSQAVKDYAAGFATPHWSPEGKARNSWLLRVLSAPSPKRLARINDLLDEVAELLWTPDPEPGPLMSFAWFMAPIADRAPPKAGPVKSPTRR